MATWIKVTSSSGRQFLAPSFAPPPALLGLERLSASPTHSVRLLMAEPTLPLAEKDQTITGCLGGSAYPTAQASERVPAATSASSDAGVPLAVLVEQYDAGAVLGHVTIAVAAPHTAEAESPTPTTPVVLPAVLQHVVNHIKAILTASDETGIQCLLDSLCSLAMPAACVTASPPASVKGGNAVFREQLGLAGSTRVSAPPTPPTDTRWTVERGGRAEDWLRRRALLSFVGVNAIPLSPLWCAMWYHEATSVATAAADVDSSAGNSSSATPHSTFTLRRARKGHPKAPASQSSEPQGVSGYVCRPAFGAIADDLATTPPPPSAKNTAAHLAKLSGAAACEGAARGMAAALTELMAAVDATLQCVGGPDADAARAALRRACAPPSAISSTAPFALPLIAAYSPSGLVTAASSYLLDISAADQVRLSAVALHHLLTAPTGPASSKDESTVRTVSFPFCARGEVDAGGVSLASQRRGAGTGASSSSSSFGLYDVVLVFVGRALAVLIGFVRTDGNTPSPLVAPFTRWIAAQRQQQHRHSNGDDREEGDQQTASVVEATAAPPSSASSAADSLVRCASHLCQAATSPCSPAVEAALQTFQAQLAVNALPGVPRALRAETAASASFTSHTAPCEPVEVAPVVATTSAQTTTTVTAMTSKQDDVDDKESDQNAEDDKNKKKKKPGLQCFSVLCAKKKKTKKDATPAMADAGASAAVASRHRPHPHHHATEVAPSSGIAAGPATAHVAALSPQAAPAANVADTAQVATTVFQAWLFAAARVTVAESQLSHAVEQDPESLSRHAHARGTGWANGVHAAFWLARPVARASCGEADADQGVSRPGYMVGFFRRSLQRHVGRGQIEDPMRMLTTLAAPIASAPSQDVDGDSALCLICPRDALISHAHGWAPRGAMTSPNTTSSRSDASSKMGLTGPTSTSETDDVATDSSTDSDDDDDSSVCLGGGDAAGDGTVDTSLLTCLSVPYTHTIASEQSDDVPAVSAYGVQCVTSLYGNHLGIEADLIDSVASHKPVLKVCKEAFIAPEEADGAARSVTLLHALQSVAHNIIESVHLHARA